jgi:hypothetical protein
MMRGGYVFYFILFYFWAPFGLTTKLIALTFYFHQFLFPMAVFIPHDPKFLYFSPYVALQHGTSPARRMWLILLVILKIGFPVSLLLLLPSR